MNRHLLARGDFLTECGLSAAVPGSLMTDIAAVSCADCKRGLIRRGVCPNCEGGPLVWSAGPVKLTTVPDGRLTMNDIETQFYLGCADCSETLIHGIEPDRVAGVLTGIGWRP